MHIKEDWQVWCISLFDEKIGSGDTSKMRANLYEVLSQELYKLAIKNLREEKCMGGLKIMLGSRFA